MNIFIKNIAFKLVSILLNTFLHCGNLEFNMNQMLKYLLNITKTTLHSNDYPSDYFAVNITIMKTATLWYPEKNSNEWQPSRAYIAFSVFALLFCVGFCTPSEFISFWDTQTDINAFTMNVGVALTHLVASIKVTNWFVRRHRLLDLMSVLDAETFRYEIYDNFIPGLIVQKAKHTNINVSTVFFWCSIMVPLSGYIVGFITLAFNNESFYITDNINGNSSVFYCTCLPFYSWIPFNHSTEATCVIAMLFQSFPMMYLTLMIVGVDTLFMSLVNYLTAHIRVLQGAFRTFRQRAEVKLFNQYGYQYFDVELLNKFTMIEMKKCLKHLQTIQRLGKTIEDVYSLQMLCQVLVSLFVLCTCLYLVSTEPMTSKTFLVEVIYIIAIEYQLTLYCWFGNELTLASDGIVEALYDSDWLTTNGAIKRCMIITMIRMKRPLYVTVGKFTPLTLTTLQAIVRLSYSMYTVLKTSDST